MSSTKSDKPIAKEPRPQVRILPELIINQIAAGEVVERPASVVKELVENAIDAKASQITVTIKNSGKDLISVLDNGIGMDEENARLAVERHATSKIYEESDLFKIQTLGFRGEALASIASVSHFELLTCHEEHAGGIRLFIKGGHLEHLGKAGFPQGTKITVENLFFNTPARLKFLKTNATEFHHIQTTVTNLALAQPHIQFRLTHNQQLLFNLSKNQNLGDRIHEIFGDTIQQELISVSHQETYLRYQGLIGMPAENAQSKRWQYLFVNQRFVKCPSIQHAVYQAYQGLIKKNDHPVFFLNIELDPSEIDVNVHPAKTEIRFRNSQLVHTILVDHLRKTLLDTGHRRYFGKSLSGEFSHQLGLFPGPSELKEKPSFPPVPASTQQESALPPSRILKNSRSFKQKKTENKQENQLIESVILPLSISSVIQQKESSLKVIGQLQQGTILVESSTGLRLIRQHILHESIIYQSYQRAYTEQTIETVSFPVPQLLNLNLQQGLLVEHYLLPLRNLGFQIEPFGGNTYAVHRIPRLLEGVRFSEALESLLKKLSFFGKQANPPEGLTHMMQSVACHASISDHQSLDLEKMQELVDHSESLDDSGYRPHGQKLWIEITYEELNRRFS